MPLWSSRPQSNKNRIVGFFPGLGSRSAYQNLGRDLLDSGFSKVTAIYSEAAQALGLSQQPEKLLLLAENMPDGKLERHGFIGAAFLVHSLALEAYLVAAAEKSQVPMGFMAYTGESFGIIAAAVSSGALSCGDGVKIAQAFTPLMMLAAEGGAVEGAFAQKIASYLPESVREKRLVPEPFHVVALKGQKEDIAAALECIEKHLKTDVQIHKFYSWQQTNVYVRAGATTFQKAHGLPGYS
jgi:malonyl CoA-acyl carrier protein transacylase